MKDKIENLIAGIKEDISTSPDEELESGLSKLQDLQYVVAVAIHSIREKIEKNNKSKYNNLD